MKKAEEIIARETHGLALECKKGCSWCCHQLIVLTCAADGEAILNVVRQRLTDSEFKAFEKLIRDQAQAINALPHTEAERRQWPCPLLKDGQCLAYDVRPVACRSVFSPDSKCCEAMLEAATFGELPAPYQRIAMAITQKALRIQVTVNNSRPIDGPVELRTLLSSLLDRKTQ